MKSTLNSNGAPAEVQQSSAIQLLFDLARNSANRLQTRSPRSVKIPEQQVIPQRSNHPFFIQQITFMSKNIGLHSHMFDPTEFQIAKKTSVWQSKCGKNPHSPQHSRNLHLLLNHCTKKFCALLTP